MSSTPCAVPKCHLSSTTFVQVIGSPNDPYDIVIHVCPKHACSSCFPNPLPNVAEYADPIENGNLVCSECLGYRVSGWGW